MRRACYTADIYIEGMLYTGVLRNLYSSARVVFVDVVKAKGISDVGTVATCSDMPHTKSWAGYMYLADMIRYLGDCVTMAAARSEELADETLEATHVGYEELPDMYTVEEALSEDAFTVYEEYPDNVFREPTFHVRKGDLDATFKRADIVLEREYRVQCIKHFYIEPEVCVCYLSPDGGIMTMHSTS